jgi:hypothetical protein
MLKLLLSLLLFSALWGNAQETKLKFFQQLYLEPNVGGGLFHTIENNKYETPSNYPAINGSLGLNFRNSIFKTGLDFKYFSFILPSIRIQTALNLHQLQAEHPKKELFFGPCFGIGYSKKRDFGGFPYLTFGLENYYHNFHFALKYDYIVPRGDFNDLKKANYLYLELGYALHLGFPK